MQNIIIMSKTPMGGAPWTYGLDGPPFYKRSSMLKSAMKEHYSDLDMPVSISVDNFTGDLAMLNRDGADLILISPYIASAFLPLSEEEEKYCLVMSEKTFLGENFSPITEKLKSLQI